MFSKLTIDYTNITCVRLQACVKFEIVMAMTVKITAFWNVMYCWINHYWCFGAICFFPKVDKAVIFFKLCSKFAPGPVLQGAIVGVGNGVRALNKPVRIRRTVLHYFPVSYWFTQNPSLGLPSLYVCANFNVLHTLLCRRWRGVVFL
jgi:hypothetical protein